jgi:hypothetical protein
MVELLADIGLQDSDKAYLAEYIANGFNKKRAYLKVHPTVTERTAEVEGSKYLRKPDIAKALSIILDAMIKETKDTLHYEILATYKARAFYELSDIFENPDDPDKDQKRIRKDMEKQYKRVIDGVSPKGVGQGKTFQVIQVYKLADRDKALDQLTKYMQLIQDKIDIKGDDIKLVWHDPGEKDI